MQNFGVTNKEHYGMLWYFLEWSIKEQVARVKKSVQNLVDNLMRVIEGKKQEIFKEMKDKAQQSIERLVEQQSDVENELQLIETSIEKTETFLKRSSNAEIVHFNTFSSGSHWRGRTSRL